MRFVCARPPVRQSRRRLSSYALGDSSAELQRLGVQHNVFAGHSRALYKRADFRRGHVIVDLGCGPGHSTLELCELAQSSGRLVAFDRSRESLALLRARALDRGWKEEQLWEPQLLEPQLWKGTLSHDHLASLQLACGDSTDWQLWERGVGASGCDRVWSRWLLTWMQREAVVATLQHAHRALRPGGVLAILDYFDAESCFRLSSDMPTPAWHNLRRLLLEEWQRVGDPCVGAKLPSLLCHEGFRLDSVEPLPMIVAAGSADWIWPTTYFATQVRRLASQGQLTERDVERFDSEWARVSSSPEAFYLQFMATIVATK